MPRRTAKYKAPPFCFHCGRILAWLPIGNDATHPVDPNTRMILRDFRAIPNLSHAAEGESVGYDRYGYMMAGLREEPDQIVPHDVACGRLIEVWNYHACDPIERERYQANKLRKACAYLPDPMVPE